MGSITASILHTWVQVGTHFFRLFLFHSLFYSIFRFFQLLGWPQNDNSKFTLVSQLCSQTFMISLESFRRIWHPLLLGTNKREIKLKGRDVTSILHPLPPLLSYLPRVIFGMLTWRQSWALLTFDRKSSPQPHYSMGCCKDESMRRLHLSSHFIFSFWGQSIQPIIRNFVSLLWWLAINKLLRYRVSQNYE